MSTFEPSGMEDWVEASLSVPLTLPWQVARITTHINSMITRAIWRKVFDKDFIYHPPAGEIFTFPGKLHDLRGTDVFYQEANDHAEAVPT
jgi:hypothetical protein